MKKILTAVLAVAMLFALAAPSVAASKRTVYSHPASYAVNSTCWTFDVTNVPSVRRSWQMRQDVVFRVAKTNRSPRAWHLPTRYTYRIYNGVYAGNNTIRYYHCSASKNHRELIDARTTVQGSSHLHIRRGYDSNGW